MKVLFSILLFFICQLGAAQMLTPAQMEKDLSILSAAWENMHPGLYRYNTPKTIQQYFTAIRKRCQQPLHERTFFILLSQLNIKLKCGHSFVSFYNQKQVVEDRLFSSSFFPLIFRVLDREFVITHNLSNDLSIQPGDKIRAINGISVSTIIDSLLTVSKADGEHGLNKKLDNISIYPPDISPKKYTLFDIFFPLFFKPNLNDSIFNVSIETNNRQNLSVRLLALSKQNREQVYKHRYGSLPTQEESWNIRELDTKTVLFKLGDFSVYNWKFDFKKYLDSVFASFKTKGYSNLILDIRQNEGGADEARDEVLSYLISKPIPCYNQIRRLYKYIRIPDSLQSYLRTWDKSFRGPKDPALFRYTKDGLYEEKESLESCDTLFPQPHRFTGKVYLITDVTNSSATFLMADIVKKFKLAKVVGEMTGGSQQGINGGQFFFLYLPNSNIEMDLPLVFQTSVKKSQDRGIRPDYEVKTKYSDIATGNDPQVKFILEKLIPNSKN